MSGLKLTESAVEEAALLWLKSFGKGGAARAAARALPRGAQEGNEAASLHPLDLGLEALVPRNAA